MSNEKLNELKEYVSELQEITATSSMSGNDELGKLYDKAQVHAYEAVLLKIKELTE